jgi:hypothetical protein
VALDDLCSAKMEAPRFEVILTTFDDILRKIEANELLELDLRGNDVIEVFFFFFEQTRRFA